MALFCVQIVYFAVNLALPRMASELDSTPTDLQWVISVYMLTLGAFMVPAGRIGDIFGRRRTLLAGVALFGLASVLCALAPSATLVIAFRALQGVGAALIFPVSVSVLTNALSAARASHAIGLAYGIAGLGNAAGPLIGWAAHRDGRLAVDLLAERAVDTRLAGHRRVEHHRIIRRDRAASHGHRRTGPRHYRN
jgi:MFS family permease